MTPDGQPVNDPDLVNTWNNAIESDWSGAFGDYQVSTTVVPGGPGVADANAITVLPGTGTSTTSSVGGSAGDWYGGNDPWVAAHEAGHLMGIDDHYHDWYEDGKRKSEPCPGWEGDIMGDFKGKASSKDIEELLKGR